MPETLTRAMQLLFRKLCDILKCQADGFIYIFSNYVRRYWSTTYAKWLKGTVAIPVFGSASSGQPQKEFNETSERTKQRKTEKFVSNQQQNLVI